ncbi:MAG: L-2-amino-thiazoline-4-carboxylic acid hydrolase [Candidatus Thorarchaeota archaeon]
MTETEFQEKLMQYFILLARTEITQSFGEDGNGLGDTFEQTFNEIFSQNEHLMPDALARRHGINSVFVLAMGQVLREHVSSVDDLKTYVLAVYRNMLYTMLEDWKEKLGASGNPWNTFVEMTKTGNQNNYENDYFRLKTVIDDKESFGFDINRCLYFEILRENGRPELGPILCEYDYMIAEAVESWARFERRETIADGNSRCTFRYRRV